MLATQMMSGAKTLPHEIGHAFNLYHLLKMQSIKVAIPVSVNSNCNSDGDQYVTRIRSHCQRVLFADPEPTAVQNCI